jgi:hypothetical protein
MTNYPQTRTPCPGTRARGSAPRMAQDTLPPTAPRGHQGGTRDATDGGPWGVEGEENNDKLPRIPNPEPGPQNPNPPPSFEGGGRGRMTNYPQTRNPGPETRTRAARHGWRKTPSPLRPPRGHQGGLGTPGRRPLGGGGGKKNNDKRPRIPNPEPGPQNPNPPPSFEGGGRGRMTNYPQTRTPCPGTRARGSAPRMAQDTLPLRPQGAIRGD